MKNKFNFLIVLIALIYSLFNLAKELVINNSYNLVEAYTIKWENSSIDFYNNKLYFKYFNKDENKIISLEKSFRLRSEREFVWNKKSFKIKYNKYFPAEPIIVGEKRNFKNISLFILFIFCLFYLIFSIKK
jgi:hypothetical protein